LFGKGAIHLGKQRIKQVFTTIQLVASIALLVSLFTIYKQLSYAQGYDLGFNKAHLLQVDLAKDNGVLLKQQIDQYPFVESSTLSSGTPGGIGTTAPLNEKDDNGENLDLRIQAIKMDENFMQTMEIELIDGREMLASDKGVSCYINEELFKRTGWQSYKGKKVNNFSQNGYEIIGVVRNFSTMSIHKTQEPAALMLTEGDAGTLSIRLRPGNLPEQMAVLEKLYKENYPAYPFQYAFYDDIFDAFYRKEAQQAKGIAVFSMIALLITCMGLIGQVFQTCLVRRKEICLRKIHGASIWDIMALFNTTFVKEVIVAFVIAAPVSYYFMNTWLQNFAYKTPLSWWVFAMAGAVTLIITLTVVSWQCWSTAGANPAEAIKNE
jgi:putative ABC transport system permease protein